MDANGENSLTLAQVLDHLMDGGYIVNEVFTGHIYRQHPLFKDKLNLQIKNGPKWHTLSSMTHVPLKGYYTYGVPSDLGSSKLRTNDDPNTKQTLLCESSHDKELFSPEGF